MPPKKSGASAAAGLDAKDELKAVLLADSYGQASIYTTLQVILSTSLPTTHLEDLYSQGKLPCTHRAWLGLLAISGGKSSMSGQHLLIHLRESLIKSMDAGFHAGHSGGAQGVAAPGECAHDRVLAGVACRQQGGGGLAP